MTDMIERVAEAIYTKMEFTDRGVGVKPLWTDGGNSHKQNEARRYARAAIEAMREPTDEIDRLKALNIELNIQASKWMQAHDCLKAGKPYHYPSPVDKGELEAEVERLKANKAEAYDILMDLRPHIAKLPPFNRPFINAHVDEAMKLLETPK